METLSSSVLLKKSELANASGTLFFLNPEVALNMQSGESIENEETISFSMLPKMCWLPKTSERLFLRISRLPKSCIFEKDIGMEKAYRSRCYLAVRFHRNL